MCLNDPNFNIEEFDRYLDQIMTFAERQAFEAKLASDEHFNEAFVFHRTIVDTVRKSPQRKKSNKAASDFRHFLKYQNEQRFKAYLEDQLSASGKTKFLQELEENDLFRHQFEQFQSTFVLSPKATPVRSIFSRTGASSWLVRVAAILFLGIACMGGLYYLFTPPPPVHYALENEFPKSEFALIQVKPEESEIPDSIWALKIKGLDAYDNGQYLTSIESLGAYVNFFEEGDEGNAFLQLFIAWSHYEKGETALAISMLRTAADAIHSPIYVFRKEYILWHLAVVYVDQGEYTEAQKTLEELLKTGQHRDLKLKSNNLLNLLP